MTTRHHTFSTLYDPNASIENVDIVGRRWIRLNSQNMQEMITF